jgi:hypothetical protein
LALVDDVQILKIHYREANVEDGYDRQHNQQQIYQLLLLVQHILLERQELHRLNRQLDHINHQLAHSE